MIEKVKDVLMRRDGNDDSEAEGRIESFKLELQDILDGGDDGFETLLEAEELIADHFGLEPDYLMEFIF